MRRGHRRTNSATLIIQNSQIPSNKKQDSLQHQIISLLKKSNNKVQEKVTNIDQLTSNIKEQSTDASSFMQPNFNPQIKTIYQQHRPHFSNDNLNLRPQYFKEQVRDKPQISMFKKKTNYNIPQYDIQKKSVIYGPAFSYNRKGKIA